MKIKAGEWLALSYADRYMAIYRTFVKNQLKGGEEGENQ